MHRETFVVWLGRFVPEKGAHLAIKASKEAGVPLVIAGVVDYTVSEAVDYFERMVKPHLDGSYRCYGRMYSRKSSHWFPCSTP